MLQESKHDGLYDDWNSNCRPFESFMAVIKGGNSVLCKWFRVFFQSLIKSLLMRSYVKKSHRNLQNISLESLPFHFLFVHIHDIWHQVKNTQAALERGTHFDGKTSYDATDLSLIIHGVRFYTDYTSNSLVCYRQSPLPQKLLFCRIFP